VCVCNLSDNSMHTACSYLSSGCRLRLKCDGTSVELRFRLSAKRKGQFISVGGGGFGGQRAAVVLSLGRKLKKD